MNTHNKSRKDKKLTKKDIQELMSALTMQLEHGIYSGVCGTSETEYVISFRVDK